MRQEQGGRCLNTRTAKTKPANTQTVTPIFNLHQF